MGILRHELKEKEGTGGLGLAMPLMVSFEEKIKTGKF